MSNQIKGYQPLGAIVFEKLKESILDGSLMPGERLMESKIAEDLGVSRTPVREAIRKLEKENYVKMVPRKGAYVEDVTKDDILEVLEIRVVLEGLAAKLAAEKMSDKSKKILTKNLESLENATKKMDRKALIKLDKKFHNIIYLEAGNLKLFEMIDKLQDQFQRFRLAYFTEFDDYIDLQTSHRKLYNAIINGNIENAEKYAMEHIETIRFNLSKWTESNE